MVRVDAAGGQIFFKDYAGSSKSLTDSAAASADWLLADGLHLSDDDVLIPTFSGQFLRRDQVNQIGGGGTLISQTLDDGASARWIHRLDPWSFKPNVSFKNELVSTASSEFLGKGLFDLNQGGIGLEAEWKGESLKFLRQSFSFNQTQYYHYRTANSPLFGTELLSDNRDLDFSSYGYEVSADYAAWEKGLLSASLNTSYLKYPHQKVIDQNALTGRLRHDWLNMAQLAASQQWAHDGASELEGSATLSVGYSILSSNQGDSDSGQSVTGLLRANPDYYSYQEFSVGPLVTATIGNIWKMTFSYNFTHRDYRNRPVQDSSGNYIGGKVRTDTQTFSYALSYPLGKGFNAQASAGYLYAYSNTHFEKYYLYNYSYPFYFVGLGYAL